MTHTRQRIRDIFMRVKCGLQVSQTSIMSLMMNTLLSMVFYMSVTHHVV